MDRILTTHVGSLIRPQALLDFLTAMEQGESYDEEAYEEVLVAAVADVVHRQSEAGIDVIDDGEMGKGSWITYLYDRVSGIESRLVPLEGAVMLPPSRDRQAFPEFYAQLDAEYARTMENLLRLAEGDREAASARDMEAEGKYWYCTGPIEYDGAALDRDIARLKDALHGVDVSDVFLPVVAPASTYWLRNEYYASEEEFVYALADALQLDLTREQLKALPDAPADPAQAPNAERVEGILQLRVSDALAKAPDMILLGGGGVSEVAVAAAEAGTGHMHSLREIVGYTVRCGLEQAGPVAGFLIDPVAWDLPIALVQAGLATLLLPTRLIEELDEVERAAVARIDVATLAEAPAYDARLQDGRVYLPVVTDYYASRSSAA